MPEDNTSKQLPEMVRKLHREACRNKKDSYTDPETGYLVFTAYHHKERGYCCDSGCRHCPYPKDGKEES